MAVREKTSPERAPAGSRPTRPQPPVAQRMTSPSCWPPASSRPSGEKATERASGASGVGSEARRSPHADREPRRRKRSRSRAASHRGRRQARGRGDPGAAAAGSASAPRGPRSLRSRQLAAASMPPGPKASARALRGPAPRGVLMSGPTRFPDLASQRPRPPSLPGHRQSPPVGRILDRRRPAGKGHEAPGPAQRLAVDQVHPAVLPAIARVRPSGLGRSLAARAGTGRCRCRCGMAVGAGGRRPRPRSSPWGPVGAGRVEGAPVGTEHLAPRTPSWKLWVSRPASRSHKLMFPSSSHVDRVRPSGLKAPTAKSPPGWTSVRTRPEARSSRRTPPPAAGSNASVAPSGLMAVLEALTGYRVQDARASPRRSDRPARLPRCRSRRAGARARSRSAGSGGPGGDADGRSER